jgi:hypothetical protein
MKRSFAILGLAAAFMRLGVVPAHPHDIWTEAREYNRPFGFPCCGGGAVSGDCEGLSEDQIWDQPDGSVIIFSSRYQARIHIPADRIMTDLPRYTSGEQKDAPLDPLVQYAAHYCGKPRPTGSVPDARDPDPAYITYCFFRNGGGM